MNQTSESEDPTYSKKDYFNELINSNYIGPHLIRYEQYIIDKDTVAYYFEFSQYDTYFYDFYFKKNSHNVFLGRYIRNIGKDMRIKINNNLLLIYETTNNKVSKVINIYNIEDIISLALTEKEALNVFDSNIDSSELESPDAKLVEYTTNNKLKKTKNLSRFVYYGD